MGNWEIIAEDRNFKLFNSPIEIGLRTLFILFQFKPEALSIDKLICFDYFLIHAGDVSKEQVSIHPKYPFRSTEIIVKREILMMAVKLLVSKELVTVKFSNQGILYEITSIGCRSLDYFESSYADELRKVSEWLYDRYSNFSEEQLFDVIHANIQKWGNEFSNESKFRGYK